MSSNTTRLHVLDALRGFAIVSITLLHNIEHFDFYFLPSNLPHWIIPLDKAIWDTLFFLFSGKSYAIFALLFGLTFFIQSNHQEKVGKDFKKRFAWRLIILLFFGGINSMFFQGDILTFYAIIGFFLIPISIFNNKTLCWIALILMLQPYEWIVFFIALQHPDITVTDPISWYYFGKSSEYLVGNSFAKTIIGNLTNGKLAVLHWNWENGRIFQTLSLFILGVLAGRNALFVISKQTKIFWIKTLSIAAISFTLLFIIKNNLTDWIHNEAICRPLETIETTWLNLAFMLILVSGFVLLFHIPIFHNVLNKLSPIGRMSLSNYVFQSIIGSAMYYGFGLGLYKYTGATYCLCIGIILVLIQGYFCSWWFKHHKQGPLESIWHRITWINI